MGGLSYLLDTHALLWALAEPEKLSPRALEALEEPSHQLWVSSVSLFEISTKVRLGKLSIPEKHLIHWALTLARLNADLLMLEGDAAVAAGNWDAPHRDPFDRLLAAQAVQADARLVTCDQAFGQFPGVRILW